MTLEKDMEKQRTIEGLLFFLDHCLGGLSHQANLQKRGFQFAADGHCVKRIQKKFCHLFGSLASRGTYFW